MRDSMTHKPSRGVVTSTPPASGRAPRTPYDEKTVRSIVARRTDGIEGRTASGTSPAFRAAGGELTVPTLLVAGQRLRKDDFQFFLRINRYGDIIAGPPGSRPFADVVAYALRVAQLVGDDLGLEQFVAMECTFKEGRYFIVVEDDGSVVALEPRPSADSSSIRESFGL